MDIERELCDELCRAPHEEAHWLVLADVLLDRGESRGELIALTSPEALRKARLGARADWWRLMPADLEARLDALTDEAEWIRALDLPTVRGGLEIRWRRGTVESVTFRNPRGIHVLRVLEALDAHWSGRMCQRLVLNGCTPSARSAHRIATHPSFVRTTSVALHANSLLATVMMNVELQLREFDLWLDWERPWPNEALGALLRAPWLDGLTNLRLWGQRLSDHQFDRLVACERLQNLQSIRLEALDTTRLRRLSESPNFRNCRF